MYNSLKTPAAPGKKNGNEINQVTPETHVVKFRHPVMKKKMVCAFLTPVTTVCIT